MTRRRKERRASSGTANRPNLVAVPAPTPGTSAPKTRHNPALLPTSSTDNDESKIIEKGHNMAFGAIFVGIIAGILGFIVALAAGYGFLAAVGVYMGTGSLITLLVLVSGIRGGRSTCRSAAILA